MRRITAILMAVAVFLLTGCANVNPNFTGVSPFRNLKDEAKLEAVDKAVNGYLEAKGLTDLSVGVITGKDTYFVNRGALEEHSKTSIGTMTQMFTGMLIGNFEHNSWIDREQVVADWFKTAAVVPVFGAAAAAEDSEAEAQTPVQPIKIWHLALGMSGLGEFNTYGKDYATGGMLHNQLAEASLAFEPGTQEQDSTLGYALLCETLRQSYNMNAKYTNLVNNQIILKMELYNSGFAKGDALAGYDGYESTTYDLLKVVGHCIGSLGEDEVLKKNIASAMEEIGGTGKSLAFSIDKSGEQAVYSRTGHGEGSSVCIAFIPELQLGVAIHAGADLELTDLANVLLDALK